MQAKIKKRIYNITLDANAASNMANLGKQMGSSGLAIKDIDKEFKEQCKSFNIKGKVIVRIEALPNNTFTLIASKFVTTSQLIFEELGIKKGSQKVGHNAPIATITDQQLTNIAVKKMKDMGINDDKSCPMYEANLFRAKKIIAGTAKSAGIITTDFNITGGK